MNKFEDDYKALLNRVSHEGSLSQNRTGVNTISKFNENLTIDLEKGFPLVTGKKMFFAKALHEYVWIRDGLTTLTYLHKHGIRWWDEFADDNGNLGKTYGYQLRNFNGEIDQLQYVNDTLKMDPFSRRMHISLWNPSDLGETILPPCYTGMTFMVENHMFLNMSVQLRSSDLFLGLPYDIAVMSLLLTNVAQFAGLVPKLLGVQITNAHIYENHMEQVMRYLDLRTYELPRVVRGVNSPYLISDYNHGPLLEAKLNN